MQDYFITSIKWQWCSCTNSDEGLRPQGEMLTSQHWVSDRRAVKPGTGEVSWEFREDPSNLHTRWFAPRILKESSSLVNVFLIMCCSAYFLSENIFLELHGKLTNLDVGNRGVGWLDYNLTDLESFWMGPFSDFTS